MSDERLRSERHQHAAIARAASTRDAMRRATEVLTRDPELRASTSTKDDFAALRTHAHAIELVSATITRYRDRPCLGERARTSPGGTPAARFETITYGELWQRVVALATALSARGLAHTGERVAIHGFASIDWVVADLACLYLGMTSVPLQTSLSVDDLAHVIAEAEPRCIVSSVDHVHALGPVVHRPEFRALVVMDEARVSDADLARTLDDARAWRADLVIEPLSALVAVGRALPPVPHAQPGHDGLPFDPLITLSYTSGSTGRPKGVLYPDTRWLQRMREALAEAPLPYVSIGYLPLSQMGGRLTTLRALVSGGLTCFSPVSDLSTFFDDARLVRPTQLMLIPRVSNMIYQVFQRRLLVEGKEREPAILDEMRADLLGDRLCLVATGAAPTAPEVLEFLARCFKISVINTYGATELGTVAVNGHVRPDIEYKLVDVPELGYTTRDRPYPRGELLVSTPYKAPGYFKGNEPAQGLEDGDGFIRSGDIVEEREPRHLVWIDRRNDVVRLQQGEFVSVARLEQVFVTGGPLIAQIFVHANPLRAYVMAVVVPHADAVAQALEQRGDGVQSPAALHRLLHGELQRIARDHGLRRHEVPREVLVEPTFFSRDNGLLTESDKPRRPALKTTYAARLEALADARETRQLRDLDIADVASLSKDVLIVRAALVVLARDEDEVDANSVSFVDLGGDSVSALRFVQLIERGCGVAPAVAAVLDPHTTLAQLAARIGTPPVPRPTVQTLHGDAPTHIRASQLGATRFVEDQLAGEQLASASRRAAGASPRVVLLTGASGFLGRFVLLELLARLQPLGGRVVCVTRARDEGNARARMVGVFSQDAALAALFARVSAGTLTCRAGDLLQPKLGLDDDTYDGLAEEVDVIVHCGALVNHMLSYGDLFEPNVLGTAEVVRLALHRKIKPIRFASSIGVAAGLRTGPISEDLAPTQLRTHFPIAAGYGVGYSASKWAGEVMLADLATRAAVPVQIFRCGMLLAHRRYLQINETDLFSRLVFGLAKTGIAPPSFYTASDKPAHFDGLPVDVVAAAIAAAPDAEGVTIYHASNDRWNDGASLDRVVDWIAEAGIPIERTDSHRRWFELMRERLTAIDETSRRRSPWGMIERWEHPMNVDDTPRFATPRFTALVRDALGEHALPELDAAFVRHCLAALDLLPRAP